MDGYEHEQLPEDVFLLKERIRLLHERLGYYVTENAILKEDLAKLTVSLKRVVSTICQAN